MVLNPYICQKNSRAAFILGILLTVIISALFPLANLVESRKPWKDIKWKSGILRPNRDEIFCSFCGGKVDGHNQDFDQEHTAFSTDHTCSQCLFNLMFDRALWSLSTFVAFANWFILFPFYNSLYDSPLPLSLMILSLVAFFATVVTWVNKVGFREIKASIPKFFSRRGIE